MRHLFARACAALLLLPMGSALAQPAETARRPITHEDVWLMQRMGALAASPDGRWFVAAVAEPSYDEDKKSSDLWIMPVDGSTPPRRLTSSRQVLRG
jgi:ABC-type sugar transport system substrate-binding protein